MCGLGHRFREGVQDLFPGAAEGGGAGPALRREGQPRGPGKDGAEDTGQSWRGDPQEEGCPGELHLGPAPRLSEAGGPIVPTWGLRAACFSIPSPGFLDQGPGSSVGAEGVSRPCFLGVFPVSGLLRRLFNSQRGR